MPYFDIHSEYSFGKNAIYRPWTICPEYTVTENDKGFVHSL